MSAFVIMYVFAFYLADSKHCATMVDTRWMFIAIVLTLHILKGKVLSHSGFFQPLQCPKLSTILLSIL